MNQEKIGKFIAICRKENGYTQASLAKKRENDYYDKSLGKPISGIGLSLDKQYYNRCKFIN